MVHLFHGAGCGPRGQVCPEPAAPRSEAEDPLPLLHLAGPPEVHALCATSVRQLLKFIRISLTTVQTVRDIKKGVC